MIDNNIRRTNNFAQLLFLCGFSIVGLFIGAVISVSLAGLMGEPAMFLDEQSLLFLRLSQIISTVFWLLIPASIYIFLFQGNSVPYLKLDKRQSILYIFLTILLIIVIQPLVGFTAYINEQVVFPESLSSIENLFREWRETSEVLIGRFIADDSLSGIILNVFIIAILAAFIEEIFFRGCFQQILLRIVNNKHIAIWITAVIFSAVHFDFYGFLPRVLLGAMLGYLFVWSGTLWVPIIAHFANNMLSLIVQKIYYGTPEYKELENFNMQDDMVYVGLSLVLTSLIIYVLIKKVGGEN